MLKNAQKAAEFQKNHRLQSISRMAEQTFAYRSYAEQWYAYYHYLPFCRWLLAAFSLVTGSAFLADQAATLIPPALAWALGVLLILLLELAKNSFHRHTWLSWYRSSVLSPMAIPALGCAALSVWMSLLGAEALYQQLDQSLETARSQHQRELDSLSLNFDRRIHALVETQDRFRESIAWQDKINISDPEIRRIIAAQEQELRHTRSEKRQAVSALQKLNRKALLQAEKEQGFSLYFWLGFTLLIEVIILVLLWFPVYYLYRIQEESEHWNLYPSFEMDMPTLQNILRQAILHKATDQLTVQSPQDAINTDSEPHCEPGSELASGLKPLLKPELWGLFANPYKYESLENYLKKHQNIVECINQGMSIKQTMKTCGVSKSTVLNVKRCLRNLHSAQKTSQSVNGTVHPEPS